MEEIAAPSLRSKLAIIVQQWKVLDSIDGKTQRSETPEEYLRQEIAKSLADKKDGVWQIQSYIPHRAKCRRCCRAWAKSSLRKRLAELIDSHAD